MPESQWCAARSWILVTLLLGALACSQRVGAQPEGSPVEVPATNLTAPEDSHFTGPRNPTPDIRTQWTTIMSNPVIAVAMALVPGEMDVYLYSGRALSVPVNYTDYAAGVIQVNELIWRNVTLNSNAFCSTIAPTPDGKLLVFGGTGKSPNNIPAGKNHVRIYDYKTRPENLDLLATMFDNRWYPSVNMLANGDLLVMGGTIDPNEFGRVSQVFERWSPEDPEKSPLAHWPIDKDFLSAVGKNFYPINIQLPTGDIYTHNANTSQAIMLIREDNTYRKDVEFPPFPEEVSIQWPHSAATVLGPLTHEDNYTSATIIIFGGAPKSNQCRNQAPDNMVLASRHSYRLYMTWTIDEDGVAQYEFPEGGWVKEDMGIPRVGGDATLLPSGDVVYLSGAQAGCLGGTLGGVPRNHFPAFWPVLYQYDKPEGERYSVLQASPIARMYHHSAALTTEGGILVAGCDACAPSSKFQQGIDDNMREFWSESPTGRWEYRNELFLSPFTRDFNNKPAIIEVNGNSTTDSVVDVGYGDVITVTYRTRNTNNTLGLVPVTEVSMVAPSASTHGNNFNQRVIKLRILEDTRGNSTGTLKIQLPDSPQVAPPQMYLLFLLNQKTNSRARWIHLKP